MKEAYDDYTIKNEIFWWLGSWLWAIVFSIQILVINIKTRAFSVNFCAINKNGKL